MKYLLAILLLIPTVAMAESYITPDGVYDFKETKLEDALIGSKAERDNAKSVMDAWTARYNDAQAMVTAIEEQIASITPPEPEVVVPEVVIPPTDSEAPVVDTTIYPTTDNHIYN